MEEHVVIQRQGRNRKFGNKGFTLIEILIVVMVLGILAMVIVPQITVSTIDAKKSALETNLTAIRNAIEMYYVQHDNTYPGMTTIAGVAITTDWATASPTPFSRQLTEYTKVSGEVSKTKTGDFIYGPYMKGGAFPANPFDSKITVVCGDSADITITTVAGAGGWMYYPQTGKILANHVAVP
jgi:prepilin-type N-terminal cleavage/methylation domain-containing protein